MRTPRRMGAPLLSQLVVCGLACSAASGFACASLDRAAAESAASPAPSPAAQPEIAPDENVPLSLVEDPNMRIMGNVPGPSAAKFCDEDQWPSLGPIIEDVREGAILVDEEVWSKKPLHFRAAAARWMSRCTQKSRSLEIRSGASGDLLAVYDPKLGLEVVR